MTDHFDNSKCKKSMGVLLQHIDAIDRAKSFDDLSTTKYFIECMHQRFSKTAQEALRSGEELPENTRIEIGGQRMLSMETWRRLLDALEHFYSQRMEMKDALVRSKTYLRALIADFYHPVNGASETRPMLTVYFDSSFLINLGKIRATKAAKLIQDLNALSVRPVLSPEIERELGMGGHYEEQNFRLFVRLQQLDLQAFRTDPNTWWDFLLFPKEIGLQTTGVFKAMDAMVSATHASSILADTELTPEEQSLWNHQNADMLNRINDDDGRISPQKLIEFYEEISAPMRAQGLAVPLLTPPDPTLENGVAMNNIVDQIRDGIGEDLWKKLEAERALRLSVAGKDRSAINVALNRSDDITTKRLAHDLRDAGHMAVFAQHRDNIDLLQVDGPQFEQICDPNSKHWFQKEGLAQRCFTAGPVDSIVPAIRETLEKLGKC